MEIWQIAAICILALPLFYLANYIIVKKMVRERKRREGRMERAIASSVAASMGSKKEKYSRRSMFYVKNRKR